MSEVELTFEGHMMAKTEDELEAIIDAFDTIIFDIDMLNSLGADPYFADWRLSRTAGGSPPTKRRAGEQFQKTMQQRRDTAHLVLAQKQWERIRPREGARARLAEWLAGKAAK